MKKYLFGILAITLAVVFSSFTSSKKFLNPKVFYYFAGTNNQRIESPGSTGLDALINSTVTFNASNWTDVNQGADTYSLPGDGSSYVKSFEIGDFQPGMPDGNSANGISLSEAIAAIDSYVSSNGYPAMSTGTVTVGSVTISDFTRANTPNP
jgi:hypothetical protein